MIKGVRVGGIGPTLSYLDTLEIPIIENTPNEEDLKESMAEAMVKYPNAPAVLVRQHGVYVWGKNHHQPSNPPPFLMQSRCRLLGVDWEKAKTQAEVKFSIYFKFFY